MESVETSIDDEIEPFKHDYDLQIFNISFGLQEIDTQKQ